jgi:hypothetical protein
MGEIKVSVPDDVEEKFREVAMSVFGHSRGSISAAASKAFQEWAENEDEVMDRSIVPANPVSSIKGILSHVDRSGEELQDEAGSIRVRRTMKDVSD